jgi:CRP-like cAMP-binding protein
MEWPLLASLGDSEREAVLAATRVRRFDRGEVLVREGDPADSLHLVEAGRLAVRVTTREGERATLNLLGPGDYFGELSLLDGRSPVRSASIVALEAARTRTLPAAAFRDLRERSKGAQQLLLLLLARRVEELSGRVVEVMYDGLDRRVHRRLHDLAELYAEDASGPAVVPLTQELLAELVGGTRPSVNQVLQRLVSQSIVELGRGKIKVVDRAALARKAG